LVILAVVISIFSLSGNNSVEKVEARIEQIVNPKATEIPDNMEADILNELKKNSKANDFAIDKIDEKKCTITSSGLLNDSDKADRIATLDAIISNIKEKKQ
jgi:hypothetical protein